MLLTCRSSRSARAAEALLSPGTFSGQNTGQQPGRIDLLSGQDEYLLPSSGGRQADHDSCLSMSTPNCITHPAVICPAHRHVHTL